MSLEDILRREAEQAEQRQLEENRERELEQERRDRERIMAQWTAARDKLVELLVARVPDEPERVAIDKEWFAYVTVDGLQFKVKFSRAIGLADFWWYVRRTNTSGVHQWLLFSTRAQLAHIIKCTGPTR